MRLVIAALICTGIGAGQSSTESAEPGPEGIAAIKLDDKHIMGVVPNYATVNEPSPIYTPLSKAEKFKTAAHDTFDPFNWVLAGLYAGAYQEQNEFGGFGQGGRGYAKRYGAVFADGAVSTYLSEGVLPTLLHEDPRYFRLGEGTKWHRIGYAMTRVLVTRTDAGGERFNNSEIFGNLLAAGISNAYYPAANRSLGDTAVKFGVGVVSDAGFNVLKEFWPDMRHRVLHR